MIIEFEIIESCKIFKCHFLIMLIACALWGTSCETSHAFESTSPPGTSATKLEVGSKRGCDTLAVQTANAFLDLSTLAGDSSRSAPATCAVLPPAQYEPRAVDLRSPSGLVIGIGTAGQIYSIRIPGIDEDIIPKQRDDAFYVDEVLQTAATNIAERRASPRGQAVTQQERRGPSWHYHQAGAYQRGALKDKPPAYSPLLYNYVDERRGVYESLNLALQAHPNPDPLDRFLVFMKFQHIGSDVFELNYTWINNSKNRNTATGEATTDLDYFNFPWMVMNNSAVPTVVAGVQGKVINLSDRHWPPSPGEIVTGAHWLGAFSSGSDDALGFAMTFPPDLGTRLRVGRTEKRSVLNVASDRSQFRYGPEGIYVVGAVRTRESLARGEAILSHSFLVFGRRDKILPMLSEYSRQTYVRKMRIPGSSSKDDLVAICRDGKTTWRYEVCGGKGQSSFVLTKKACTDCLPVYEMMSRASGDYVYSTDPYFYQTEHDSQMSASDFTIIRILGWLYRRGTNPPEGYRPEILNAGNAAGIRLHASDAGEYFLLK